MAGRIPQTFIQELLSRCDIIDVIDSRVPLKKKGNNYSACCPFHQEKTPSFTVSASKQFYHCFGCGEHGNAISFIMNYDRLGFIDAIETLSAQLGLAVPIENQSRESEKQFTDLYQIMQQAAEFYTQQMYKYQEATNYLHNRGLNNQVLQKYNIGYAPNAWDNLLSHFQAKGQSPSTLKKCNLAKQGKNDHYYDSFRHRIMFPIRDRKGRVVAFGGRVINNEEPKYLNSSETPIFHKSSEVYGLYEALQSNRTLTYAILVEGYMDVLALAQFNFTQAMACMGTAITQSHLSRIFKYTNTIVFCFDGDIAGRKAAWRAAQNLLPLLRDGLTAKFIFLAKGEDPDSFLRANGEKAMQILIDDAEMFSQFFWQSVKSELALHTMEGKAALNQRCAPLIQQMPNSSLKLMMEQTLQQYTGITPQKVPQIATHKKRIAPQALTPMRAAIALLIQFPELAKEIDATTMQTITGAGSELFHHLVDYIDNQQNCNTANIIEAWRDTEHYSALSKLAALDLMVSDETAHNQFIDILQRITENFYATIEEQLYLKMQNGNIEAIEKTLLMNLQKLKQNLLSDEQKEHLLSQLVQNLRIFT